MKWPFLQKAYVSPLTGTQAWPVDILGHNVNWSDGVTSEQKLYEPTNGYHVLFPYGIDVLACDYITRKKSETEVQLTHGGYVDTRLLWH